jgi:predicted nucleic acid-binding protein
MSAEFVDTNVLVYAYDPSSVKKHRRARELLEELWERRTGRVSVQVLQEFYWTVTRKVPKPLARKVARDHLQDLSAWDPFAPTADDVLSAIALERENQISFWDAMILQAAIRSDCSVLWSEDFSHGVRYGTVRVKNPF